MTASIFTREQAKESDRKLVELITASRRAWARFAGYIDRVHRKAGDDYRRRFDSRSGWKLSDQEALAKVSVEANGSFVHLAQEARQVLDDYTQARAATDKADEAVRDHQQEWWEHGKWPRFLVVPGGHIHDNDGCYTLRPTTDTRWIPELSGDTEADAVEMYGAALCSHCYPTAPSDWRERATVPVDSAGNPLPKAQRDALKAERQAEKDAKAAAKAAAEVRDPLTGKVLYKTDKGATNAIASALKDMRWYEFDHPSMGEWEALVTRTVAALAAKAGCDPAQLRAELDAKADKAFQATLRASWRELKADCASGRWSRSSINMNSRAVRYGKSIGEELQF